MELVKLDEGLDDPALRLGTGFPPQSTGEVVARRAPVPAPMWDEQDVAGRRVELAQLIARTRERLAAVVPDDRRERAVALRLVQVSAQGLLPAGERDEN